MIVNRIIFTTILLFYSCTSTRTNQQLHRRNTEAYVIPSSIIQYFLPELPPWANTSKIGKCKRNRSIRFFDFDKLSKSFLYSFEQLLVFQHMFNVEKASILKDRKYKYLGLKEQEQLFYSISVNTRAGIKAIFIRPDFKRIHLLWIDPFITGEREKKEIKTLFTKDEFNKGHPVFISQCLMHDEIKNFIEKNDLPRSIRILSSEFLTPFARDLRPSHHMIFHVGPLFDKNQEIYFYTPTFRPDNIMGTFSGTIKI